MARKKIQDSLLWVSILLLQIAVNSIAADPVGTCPTHNVIAFLTHSYDCTKFYKCDWGKPVEYDCPGGLYFNPRINVCDWPEASGCVPGSPPTPTTSAPIPTTNPAVPTTEAPTVITNSPVTTSKPETPVPTLPPSGGPGVVCPPIHEENATLLPHPTDCTKFYYCVWGTPIETDCPAGLHFNPILKVCDWPWDAGCDPNYSTSAPGQNTPGAPAVTTNSPVTTSKPEAPVPTLPPSGGPGVVCPPIHEENATLLPHPTDCTKFYYCVWGTPIETDCPAGLHFNPILKVCDWPWDAGCDPNYSTSAPGQNTPGAPAVTTNSPVTTSKPEAPVPTLPPSGGPGVVCPPIHEENATLLPHPTDCTKFYYCVWGTPIETDCPAGLHFNPILKVCDWPWDAGCDPNYSTSAPGQNTPGAPAVTTNSPVTTSKPEAPVPTLPPSGGPGVVCPPIHEENATLLPHPTDCTKFYYCVWGTPIETDCPAGLHFNPILKVCDWPWDAGCDPNYSTSAPGQNTPGDPAVTTNSPVTTSKPEAPVPTLPPSGGPGVVCPPIHEENATLLPHPTDCTKFYYCVWGTPIETDCPAGLHFNPTLKVCDWPWDAGCDPNYSTSAPGQNTPGAPAVTTNSPVTTSKPEAPVPTLPPSGGPGVVCPPIHEENATLLPHPTDCTKFYYCVWGTPIETDCPAGLHFNPILKVCDWPWDAGCDPNYSTSAPGQNTPGAPAVTTNSPVTTSKPEAPVPTLPPSGGPGVVCPPIHEENATLLPHPTDCTKFYYCVWGTPIETDCPAGLHFNPILKVCDWPWDAGCDPNYSTSAPGQNTPGAPAVTTNSPVTTSKPEAPVPTLPPSGGPGVVCPPIHEENATLLPHPTDCTKFYFCVWGTPIETDCPAGLHFNPILKVCDWPWDAGCDPNYSTSAPGQNTPGAPAVTTNSPVTTSNPEAPVPTLPPSGGPGVVCPPIHEENATLLPHPTDCTKFYFCVWGTPIETDCPAGLHFNPILKVCDWPWDAGCDPNYSTSAPGQNTPGAPAVTTNSPVTTSKPEAPVPTLPPSGGPGVVCPPIHEENATLLPHPTDCTKFYYCVWGTPIETDCPAGLHFNPILKVCDWPWDAGCDPNYSTSAPGQNTPGAPAVTTNSPVTTSKPEAPVPTLPPSGGPGVICPPFHEENATLLPHPTDCTKFYYCVWGTPVETDCPAGLHFNPTLKVCDWPWDAGCEAGDSTSAPAPSTPGAPATTAQPPASQTTTAPAATTPNAGGAAGTCPLLNGEFPVYLPNTADCTKFFECDWGVPYPFDCPPGLHFNPTLNVCDYPYSAGCVV